MCLGGAEKEMEVVIDTNKILSAILTSGKVRKIIVFSPLNFMAPKYLLIEVLKHKHRLCKRFKIPLEIFDYIANELICPRIKLIDEEFYKDCVPEAFEISKRFDEWDTPFIALALKLNVPIWTNDKKLIEFGLKTGKYLAIDTRAIEDLLKGKSLSEIKKDLERKYL